MEFNSGFKGLTRVVGVAVGCLLPQPQTMNEKRVCACKWRQIVGMEEEYVGKVAARQKGGGCVDSFTDSNIMIYFIFDFLFMTKSMVLMFASPCTIIPLK